MPIFMMFGKYSTEALKGISSKRTDKAVDLIKKNGGKVISMYAVMGEHDLVLRNGDEITSPTMHHSFRPPLPDLKSQKYQNSLLFYQLL